tara:strand:+ start:8111 stop:8401 length:291 start_codon:yes stop_codon:yes gene_type:complete
MKVIFKKSNIEGKKYTALFYDDNNKKIKTVHFGSSGMSDYTKNKDDERKKRYLQRHRARENWNDYKSAGSLSRYILWNKKTLKESIIDYKKRFNLK